MSNNYTPTIWIGGETVGTANVMNNMEHGIGGAHDRLDEIDTKLLDIDSKINTVDSVAKSANEYIMVHVNDARYPVCLDGNTTVTINPSITESDDSVFDGAVFKSFSDLALVCPRNLNGWVLTIKLGSNVTEDVVIDYLNSGTCDIFFNGYTLNGYLKVFSTNTVRFRIYGGTTTSSGRGALKPSNGISVSSDYYAFFGDNSSVTFVNVDVYPATTSGVNNCGICFGNGANGYMSGIKFYKSPYIAVRTYSRAYLYSSSSNGVCTHVAFSAVSGSYVILNPTTQVGSAKGASYGARTSGNAQIISDGVTWDSVSLSSEE